MIAENLDATNWNSYDWRGIGFTWFDQPTSWWPRLNVNGEKGTSPGQRANQWYFARPSSNHPCVCNFAYVDGHVRTIGEEIAYTVYAQLCTPDGLRARGSSNGALRYVRVDQYILDDADVN